jgi:hypothetical protein
LQFPFFVTHGLQGIWWTLKAGNLILKRLGRQIECADKTERRLKRIEDKLDNVLEYPKDISRCSEARLRQLPPGHGSRRQPDRLHQPDHRHLTQRGWMDASALYESPFVDYSSKGVDGLFNTVQVDKLVSILNEVRQRAAA